MPIYEYRCKSCGAVREVLQKMSDKPLKKCAKCPGALEKLVSRSSFQLKGTGWYVSDSARKNKASGESSDAPSSKEASSADASTSAAPKAASGPKSKP